MKINTTGDSGGGEHRLEVILDLDDPEKGLVSRKTY